MKNSFTFHVKDAKNNKMLENLKGNKIEKLHIKQ